MPYLQGVADIFIYFNSLCIWHCWILASSPCITFVRADFILPLCLVQASGDRRKSILAWRWSDFHTPKISLCTPLPCSIIAWMPNTQRVTWDLIDVLQFTYTMATGRNRIRRLSRKTRYAKHQHSVSNWNIRGLPKAYFATWRGIKWF